MKEYITINDIKYDVKSFSTSGTNIVKITFSEDTDIKPLISNMDIFKSIKMYTQRPGGRKNGGAPGSW